MYYTLGDAVDLREDCSHIPQLIYHWNRQQKVVLVNYDILSRPIMRML